MLYYEFLFYKQRTAYEMRISDWSSDVCSSDLFRMIEAEQSCAVKRDIANKFDKGVLHPVEAAIMVEMFGIDIGDDRYGAVQAQETAVAFIGFHHHPVAGAKPGVGAVAVDDPAIDAGRSEEHTSELQSLMRI